VSDNELVLSASQTEILLIKIAEHELQQLRDITNEHPPQQVSSYTQKDMFGDGPAFSTTDDWRKVSLTFSTTDD
jgi:hypothetical protein